MSEQNNATRSLAHTKWNCKYHIVFAPKYRRKVFYKGREADPLSIFDPREQVFDAWLAGLKAHLCAASSFRAMPENEIPPR